MADNSSTLPDALQDFLRYCAQPSLQLDSIKPTTQKIVKQALIDILEPIKPGRFLLETRSISRKNKVETAEQDEEEEEEYSDHGGYGEAYVEVNHRPIAIWQYLGKEWSEQIVGFVQASPSSTTQLLTLRLMTVHSTEYSAFRATVLASHGTSPMATHWRRKAALLGFDEVLRWNLWR
jgi:hypothetical protein